MNFIHQALLFNSCAISSELDLYYTTKVHFVAFMLFNSFTNSSELDLYYSTKVHFVAFMLFHSCAISSKLESLILEITKPQLSLRLMFSFLVGKTGYERHSLSISYKLKNLFHTQKRYETYPIFCENKNNT